MDLRQRVEAVLDDPRPHRRRRLLQQPSRLGVGGVVRRDVALDLAHHEERRAEDRIVVLEPVHRRERHVGVVRQRLDHLVLRVEVGFEEDRVRGRLHADHVAGRPCLAALVPRGVEEQRLVGEAGERGTDERRDRQVPGVGQLARQPVADDLAGFVQIALLGNGHGCVP